MNLRNYCLQPVGQKICMYYVFGVWLRKEIRVDALALLAAGSVRASNGTM
jgi:hypothetical protein